MDDKKKKIIYLSLISLLSLAFITLYLLDNEITKSEGKDAFSVVYDTIEPALENPQVNDNNTASSPKKDEGETIVNYEKVKIIEWDISKIDSIQIFSKRKDFSLIQKSEKNWLIKSARLDTKVPRTNNALFRLLNVFGNLITNNYLTQDYSLFAKYFEYPICTVIANFKDGTQGKLTFIRIAEINEYSKKTEMKSWLRVNDETVVYAVTYNILERFLVKEKEFLKIY